MAGKRFRAEQIIMKLREAEVGLAQGQRVGQVSKQMGVSEADLLPVAQRVRRAAVGPGQEVEGIGEGEYPVEEAVADLSLDKQILKEVSSGNF